MNFDIIGHSLTMEVGTLLLFFYVKSGTFLNLKKPAMNWRDLELLLELRYILGAIGVLVGTWLLSYFLKQFRIKRRIRDRHEECQASLKKLEEYLGENGVGGCCLMLILSAYTVVSFMHVFIKSITVNTFIFTHFLFQDFVLANLFLEIEICDSQCFLMEII